MKLAKKTFLTLTTIAVIATIAYVILSIGTGIQRKATLTRLQAIALPSADAPYTAPDRNTNHQDSSTGVAAQRFYDLFTEHVRLLETNAELKALLEQMKQKPLSAWPPGTANELTAQLQSHENIFERLIRAIDEGGPVNVYEQPEDLDRKKSATDCWELGRLLNARALLSANAGNLEAAVNDFLAVLRLSGMLASEPVPLTQYVRAALVEDTAMRIAQAFPPGTRTPNQRRLLIDALAQERDREGFASALAAEAIVGDADWPRFAEMLRNIERDASVFSRALLAIYGSPVAAPWSNLDRGSRVDAMMETIDLFEVPFYEAREALPRIATEIDDFPSLYFYARFTPETGLRFLRAQAEHQATIDLAMLGIAIEGHRSDTGAYPTSLDEITNTLPHGIPRDPFTGQPYIYIPALDTFQLYSPGPNLHVDGGQHGRDRDLVWCAP